MSDDQMVFIEPKTNQLSPDIARAIQEVRAEISIAKEFPRDMKRVKQLVIEECKDVDLAEKAFYALPVTSKGRAAKPIEGISVRLAEAMIRAYKNADYGFRVLESGDNSAYVQCFVFDKENNIRLKREIEIQFRRKADKQYYKIEDPVDQQRHIANFAQRTVRALILEIIPMEIKEAAKDACEATLRMTTDKGRAKGIEMLVALFNKLGVFKNEIEERIGKQIEKASPQELTELKQIAISIQEGESFKEDWFTPKATTVNEPKKETVVEVKKEDGPKITVDDIPFEDTPKVDKQQETKKPSFSLPKGNI